ncbi:MAG: hypothetical protein LC102_09705 [Ignavibacteriales bacterium]|nr:MAG: hypothetical protein F9K26_01335 [Ignavibacteriaceae bacterium]MBW7872052.1 hypothetical protein [Ignavibacteria bacterium]MCZ2143687.1 hypothetical protein [Ignavibacteriales bacterium]OQY79721.1 MAG: hypothetical protein B6D45_00405 [Ignavibacteriales bacterium UTCHB3]MBV6446051.1 hypothetical protein [Ignavibacteriaceae bacterium]
MKQAAILFFFVFVFGVSAIAQPGPGYGGRGKHYPRGGDGGRRLEQLEKVKLIEYLNLDEETMVRLLTRREEHRKTMDKRSEQADSLVDLLEKLTKENKNGDKNSDLNAGIKKFTDFVAESRGMEMKFLTSLTEILTPEQLAKYIIFERNFRKELRELLRRP